MIIINEKEKGITIIALIITVIVLIILAGVTIEGLNSNIIQNAMLATQRTNLEKIREEIYFKLIDVMKEENINEEYLKNILSQYGSIDSNNILSTKYGDIDLNELIRQAEREYLELDISTIKPGESFEVYNGKFNANVQTIYTKLDISELTNSTPLQNILSIGENIDEFYPSANQINIHFYYPSDDGKMIISFTNGNKTAQYKYSFYYKEDLKNLTIALNANGLYINNVNIYSEDSISDKLIPDKTTEELKEEWNKKFFNLIKSNDLDIQIGSKEGVIRSEAKYETIRIYNKLIPEKGENYQEYKDKENINIDIIKPNQKFSVWKGKINLSESSIYAELDISNIDKTIPLQNILSIGTDISNWEARLGDKANLHLYYLENNDIKQVYISVIVDGSNQYQGIIELDPNTQIIKVQFGAEGLMINEKLIINENGASEWIEYYQGVISNIKTFFDKIKNKEIELEIGSKQGTNRSTAEYKKIFIHKN